MIKPSPDDKVYPVIKLATVIDALAAEGIPAQNALAGARLSREAMSSPATRISLNQVIECYRNAAKLSREPHFSYHAGLRFHLSAYGMYGFAILSSMSYRQTMQFAEKYHQLATPLAELHFKEQSGCGVWTIAPMPHSRIDGSLYKFLVEMQFGICVSLHRDVMGPLFAAREFDVTLPPTRRCREISGYLWMSGVVRRARKPACVRRDLARWHTKARKRHNLRVSGRTVRSPDG
jgi:hypothetical protein